MKKSKSNFKLEFTDELSWKKVPWWADSPPSRCMKKLVDFAGRLCGSFFFLDGSAVQQSDESESHLNFARSSANQKRTIESMIVVEKMMTKFYGVDQIKKYVPTIVNMVT